MSIIRLQRSGRGIGASLAGAMAAAVLLALAIVGPALASDRGSHLADAQVTPRLGAPTTSIVFTVTYRDTHGDPADVVTVVIDGSTRAMTADGGSILGDGVHYRLATTLPVGIHVVLFKASAAGGPSFAPGGVVKIVAAGGDGTGSTDPGGATGGGTTGGNSPTGGTGGDGGTGTGTGGTGTGGTGGTSTGTGTGGTGGTGGDAPTGGGSTGPQASTGPGTSGDAPSGPAATPRTTTGGSHTTHGDPPASTGHSKGTGTTGSGSTKTGDAATKTSDPAGQSTAAPNMPFASADGAGDANSENALAFGGGSSGSGNGGPGGGDGSSLNDRTLTALGIGGLTPTQRMVLAAISTTTTTTTIMAFIVFGKRRRDGEPPAPDEVLAANAARMVAMPSSMLVPAPAANPAPPATRDAESELPRWRRPSLLAARKADPLRSTASPSTLSFDRGVAAPIAGRERRQIRYRLVRLLDAPDELRSAEIGFLDQGDEVQLLESSGSYWLVLCPDGGRGWLHRMTLGDVVEEAPAAVAKAPDGDAVAGQPDSTLDEDGAGDLLSAYLRQRHQS